MEVKEESAGIGWIGHVLVALQMLGMGLVSYKAITLPGQAPWMLVFTAAGILLGFITLGYNRIGNFNIHPNPKKQGHLITSGPYRWIRHPMYVSVILFSLGLAGFVHAGWTGFVLASLAVITKAFLEERMLIQKHPAYAAYREETSMFIPYLF